MVYTVTQFTLFQMKVLNMKWFILFSLFGYLFWVFFNIFSIYNFLHLFFSVKIYTLSLKMGKMGFN